MNIAEGCGKSSDASLAQYLDIAIGYASELKYQLLLVKDLGFVDADLYAKLSGDVVEIKKMLTGFIKKVKGR
jgi:four helix bundle protein